MGHTRHFTRDTPSGEYLYNGSWSGQFKPRYAVNISIKGKLATSLHACKYNKAEWVVKTFKPYKSPDRDGIIFAFLQQYIEKIVSSMCSLFRASVALRYVPSGWKNVKVVFTPKRSTEESCRTLTVQMMMMI